MNEKSVIRELNMQTCSEKCTPYDSVQIHVLMINNANMCTSMSQHEFHVLCVS